MASFTKMHLSAAQPDTLGNSNDVSLWRAEHLNLAPCQAPQQSLLSFAPLVLASSTKKCKDLSWALLEADHRDLNFQQNQRARILGQKLEVTFHPEPLVSLPGPGAGKVQHTPPYCRRLQKFLLPFRD